MKKYSEVEKISNIEMTFTDDPDAPQFTVTPVPRTATSRESIRRDEEGANEGVTGGPIPPPEKTPW